MMSSELIKVTVQNDQQLVSARELHKGLELTTRFSKWVDQNFRDFELGIDFTSVTTVTEVQNNGGTQQRKLQDYALTIDDDEKAEDAAKEFIKAQLPNIIGEDDEDE